jgi:hypothetical protein
MSSMTLSALPPAPSRVETDTRQGRLRQAGSSLTLESFRLPAGGWIQPIPPLRFSNHTQNTEVTQESTKGRRKSAPYHLGLPSTDA